MRFEEIDELAWLIIEHDEVYLKNVGEGNTSDLKHIASVDVQYNNGLAVKFKDESLVEKFIADSKGEMTVIEFVSHGSSTKILSSVEYQGNRRVVLKKVRELEKVRLRRFPRVDAKIDHKIHEVDSNGKPSTEIPHLKDRKINISGGGFLFHCWRDFQLECKLLITIELPDEKPIQLLARVVRCFQDNESKSVFSVAVEFIEIERKAQEAIVSYVSKQQRTLIRQGNIPESK